ncbi:kinase-like domain-containing protein [Cladorrhinum sp. PSN332]|nr:kinase-like domain-containing protein [Cladorrhinum sp. PSN332]
MELFTLGSLGGLLRAIPNKKLKIHKTQPLVRQIVMAAANLHSLGMTHRDIKPKNVIILSYPVRMGGGQWSIQLCDLGMASDYRHYSQERPTPAPGCKFNRVAGLTACGTDVHLPPEVWGHIPSEEATPLATAQKRDSWALGETIFRILTWTHSFSDAEPWPPTSS